MLRKGGLHHKTVGSIFAGSMLVMTAAGAALAIAKPDRITAVMGVFTFYLVLTSWVTARAKGVAGRFEGCAFVAGCVITAMYLSLGIAATRLPHGRIDNLPGTIAFVFGGIAVLASALDLNFILRRRLTYRQRTARHLWRMCVALFIAAMSFFIGQQKVMPVSMRGAPLLYLPPFAVLGAMAFWIARTRFAGQPTQTRNDTGYLELSTPGERLDRLNA